MVDKRREGRIENEKWKREEERLKFLLPFGGKISCIGS